MNNNATKQIALAARELREAHGVVTFKRARRCRGCGRAMTRLDPEGACLACKVQRVEVSGKPKAIKRRAVPEVYCPTVFSFGVLSGRAVG